MSFSVNERGMFLHKFQRSIQSHNQNNPRVTAQTFLRMSVSLKSLEVVEVRHDSSKRTLNQSFFSKLLRRIKIINETSLRLQAQVCGTEIVPTNAPK